MEHTKEPWVLHARYGEICYKSDEDDQSFGMWCPVNLTSEDNLRRIVACVNACEHISTDELESTEATGGLLNWKLNFYKVQEQRDAVQSAVEYYEALIDYLHDVVPCIDAVIAEFDAAWENNLDDLS